VSDSIANAGRVTICGGGDQTVPKSKKSPRRRAAAPRRSQKLGYPIRMPGRPELAEFAAELMQDESRRAIGFAALTAAERLRKGQFRVRSKSAAREGHCITVCGYIAECLAAIGEEVLILSSVVAIRRNGESLGTLGEVAPTSDSGGGWSGHLVLWHPAQKILFDPTISQIAQLAPECRQPVLFVLPEDPMTPAAKFLTRMGAVELEYMPVDVIELSDPMFAQEVVGGGTNMLVNDFVASWKMIAPAPQSGTASA
jgi:hypothetical protein